MNMSNKNKYTKAVIIILCVLVLTATLILAIALDKNTSNIFTPSDKTNTQTTEDSPLKETESPETDKETDKETDNKTDKETLDSASKEDETNEVAPLPEELPSTVIIPTEKDPQTGKDLGVSFPCEVPEYHITLEKLANHTGMFVETGLNQNNMNIAMMLVKNKSDYPIEYMSISVEFEKETLVFDITAFPKGESLVVQEKTGKSMPDSKPLSCKALIVRKAKMEMSENIVSVKDNGNNTITVENLTGKTIPTVRVFYKYYMKDEDVYVGGIAFTMRLSKLQAKGKVTVQPSHYTSGSCKVVMVLTYDEEV